MVNKWKKHTYMDSGHEIKPIKYNSSWNVKFTDIKILPIV